MISLCLLTLGLALLVFFLALRRTGDGYQDNLGFHHGRKAGSDMR